MAASVSVLSVSSTSVLGDMPFVIPKAIGQFSDINNCAQLAGRYKTAGECALGSCQPLALSLRHILNAPYPPKNMVFDKNDKRYTDLAFDGRGLLQVRIAIGDYITAWETQSYSCEQGWLRLSRYEEGGSEGNTTKVTVTSFLRRNNGGDLVVSHVVTGRTSNIFGLVWSHIDEQSWLIFKGEN